MEEPKKKRAAAYCRVSTKQDLQDGSFEMQCTYYQRKIGEDPDLELAGIYGDHGKSGRTVKGRKELNHLLKDCKAGKVDVIYTKSISRFARNMEECIELIRRLREWKFPSFLKRRDWIQVIRETNCFLAFLPPLPRRKV